MENEQEHKHTINNSRYTARRSISKQDKKNFSEETLPHSVGKWRKNGDSLIVIMDANEHTMVGKLRKMLETEGIGLVEYSHESWGDVPPNTYINGNDPIYA